MLIHLKPDMSGPKLYNPYYVAIDRSLSDN